MVKTPCFYCRRAQVPSLEGELRSHMLHGPVYNFVYQLDLNKALKICIAFNLKKKKGKSGRKVAKAEHSL